MKSRIYTLLLHPIFLISLVLLLLNDFFLKYEFHNGLTGKLSDFAGLFVFTVFVSLIFNTHKRIALLITGLLFLWWKSPLSDSLIIFFNTQLQLPLHRVVDYSDYAALIVLPLSAFIKPIGCESSLIRSIAIWCVGIVSFFSFTATSMIRKLADDNRVELNKTVKTKKTETEIIDILKKNGMSPKKDTALYERVWDDRYYVKSRSSSGETTMTPLDSLSAGLYRKLDYGSVYTIPGMYVAGDSIYNLRIMISDWGRSKKDIWLHSFQCATPDSANHYFSGYPEWRKYRHPIKKRFKALLR